MHTTGPDATFEYHQQRPGSERQGFGEEFASSTIQKQTCSIRAPTIYHTEPQYSHPHNNLAISPPTADPNPSIIQTPSTVPLPPNVLNAAIIAQHRIGEDPNCSRDSALR